MNPDLGVSVGWEIKMHREESIKYWGSEDGFRRQEDFARTMFKLNLSYEEIAVLRGIVILFRGNCDTILLLGYIANLVDFNNNFVDFFSWYSFVKVH